MMGKYFIATKIENKEYSVGKPRTVYYIFRGAGGKGKCTTILDDKCIGIIGNVEDEISMSLASIKGFTIEEVY